MKPVWFDILADFCAASAGETALHLCILVLKATHQVVVLVGQGGLPCRRRSAPSVIAVPWGPRLSNIMVRRPLCQYVCISLYVMYVMYALTVTYGTSRMACHVCMYVCLYVCMYRCIYVCIYVSMYASMCDVCMHAFMYV